MTEELLVAPDANGRPALPKRGGPGGLLPSTWLSRGLRVERVDAWGEGCVTSGVLLDYGPVGLVLNVKGARTLLSWDSVRLIELVEER